MSRNDEIIARADDYVTRAEFIPVRNLVHRLDLALFGLDGRAGMQHDMVLIKGDLKTLVDSMFRLEATLAGKEIIEIHKSDVDLKRLGIIVTLISVVVTSVVAPVVQALIGIVLGGGS